MSSIPSSISIIVPHLNQQIQLRSCLCSLKEQLDRSSVAEIIVVDNGSETLPVDICEEFDAVILKQEKKAGPGPARNHGVAISQGSIVAFIDADCQAHPGWIAAISSLLSHAQPHNIWGGDVRIALENPSKLTLIEAYESIFAYRQKEYIELQGFSGTGNLAMRREYFDMVGPFAGIHVSEDRDWGQRAEKLGLSITYVPDMIVYHPARKNLSELYSKWDRHIDHDYEGYKGKPFWYLRWAAYAAAVAVSPVFEIRRIATSNRVHSARDRFMAAMVLIAVRLYRAQRMLYLLFSGSGSKKSQSWNRG